MFWIHEGGCDVCGSRGGANGCGSFIAGAPVVVVVSGEPSGVRGKPVQIVSNQIGEIDAQSELALLEWLDSIRLVWLSPATSSRSYLIVAVILS